MTFVKTTLMSAKPHRHPGAGRDPDDNATVYTWITRDARPTGRPLGVQRAMRFCPACAGMTVMGEPSE